MVTRLLLFKYCDNSYCENCIVDSLMVRRIKENFDTIRSLYDAKGRKTFHWRVIKTDIKKLRVMLLALKTDLFPFNSGNNPAKAAAIPVAPAPSTTHFSSSTNLSTAMAI